MTALGWGGKQLFQLACI